MIAGVQAYFMQRIFVWKSQDEMSIQLFRFVIVLFLQFTANFFLLYLLVGTLKLNELGSQYAIGLSIALFTFFAHKNWTFRPDNSQTKAE